MSTLKTNSITHISNSGTANLSLDSSGNVGIGTASPNSFTNYTTLTINGGSDGAGIDLELSDNNIYGRLFGDTSGLQIQSAQSGDAIRFQTNGSNERMRITSDGKVGIGTTTPADLLDVAGSIGVTGGLKVASHPVVGYASTLSSYAARLGSTGTSTLRYTQLYAGGSLIATCDGTNGRVGIGTTSPSDALEISHASDPAIRLHYGSNSGYSVINIDSNNDVQIHVDPSGAGSNSNFQVHIDGTEMLELQNDGDLKLNDGDFIVGTSGHGVLFHSHASGNNLNDYEEGTYTPAVEAGATNTQQFNAQGRYTKIGRQVYCQFLLQWSGQGNGTQIKFNMPFVGLNNGSLGGGVCLWTNIPTLSGHSSIILAVQANTDQIACHHGMDSQTVTSSSFSNSAFYGVFQYEAA